MKLIYNGVDLATLGTLRLLTHTTVREPAEAPQRERLTYRVRLDFFEPSYRDNHGLIEQCRAALRTQQAQLIWTDGATFLNRTVTAGDDETPGEPLEDGGTFWQALQFTFWFYNHDVVTNCLVASYQRTGGEALTLGTVEKEREALAITRFDEIRDGRKLVQGTLQASGRFQGNTNADLNTRRNALLALKDQWRNEIAAASTGTFSFGTFNRVIRITEFTAEVDQPANYIGWSLAATFTIYPDLADYAVIEVTIQQRENLAEGIKYCTIAGQISAPSRAAADTRIATLRGALAPAGYVTLAEDVTEVRGLSESGTGGDGTTFISLRFSFEYRDPSSVECKWKRTGAADGGELDLGTVDKFSDRYAVTLFDEMRNTRRRAAGLASLSGKWYVADSLTDEEKKTALATRLTALRAELVLSRSGRLTYGTIFAETVRVLDFDAALNRLRNCIEWSLSASFTRFPDEADYCLAEFTLDTRENKTEGTVVLNLTGRIGAPTPEMARAKLARLRLALIPSGYTLLNDGAQDRRVASESGGGGTTVGTGDGESYIELAFNDEWQKTGGDLLTWALRIATEDDVKSGMVRITYSGMVSARGSSLAAAYVTAAAQAAVLGDNKFVFKIRSSLTENQKLFQTSGGVVFVTVDFAYEYLRKGPKIYTEVTSELAADTFGLTVENVSGVIAAPTLALALATYNTDVRNVAAYDGGLILSERKPTLSEQRLGTELGNDAALFDRFAFSLQLFRSKDSAQTAVRLDVATSGNLQTLEKTVSVSGEITAASEAVATTYLGTLLTGLGLTGTRLAFSRTARSHNGPRVGSAGDRLFITLAFSETYKSLLTGLVSGILESDVNEDVTFSAKRLVQKPVPGLPDVIQGTTGALGQTCGSRVVQCRCVATTKVAGDAWVRSIRTALITGTNEQAPRVNTGYRFLEQIAGVPVGGSSNVRVYEIAATFSELLPDHPFV